jgi:hypothetical protein
VDGSEVGGLIGFEVQLAPRERRTLRALAFISRDILCLPSSTPQWPKEQECVCKGLSVCLLLLACLPG